MSSILNEGCMREVSVPHHYKQVLVAMEFAKKKHYGQLRKYTNEPYIVHPFAVSGLVMSVTHDTSMIIAALLHDTIEDTETTEHEVKVIFGADVFGMVQWLTNTATKADGNRAKRKLINQRRLAGAPPEVQTIKLADIIDNVKTIMAFDPKFAKTYMAEKQATIKLLQQGDPTLLKIATDIVADYYNKNPRVQLGEIHENSNA